MRRGAAPATVLLLTGALLGAPGSTDGPPPAAPVGESPGEEAIEDGPSPVLAFFAALETFREATLPDDSTRVLLDAALQGMADDRAARAVLGYFESLDREARRTGIGLEREFDGLHARAAELDGNGSATGPSHAALLLDLETFVARAEAAKDVTPLAHALSLAARLEVRALERGTPFLQGAPPDPQRAATRAEASIHYFDVASQRTPSLEPLWLLARVQLLTGETAHADDTFQTLEELAARTGRDLWRERALLGLIGTARERGASYEAERAIERLAEFRSPESCWALAREVAVERLGMDDGQGALEWLGRYPPAYGDPEIDPEEALDEWRALVVASQLRSGRHDEAAAILGTDPNTPVIESTETLALARWTWMIDSGRADAALAELRQGLAARASGELSALGTVEHRVLLGRALAATGHLDAAADELEAALGTSIARESWRGAAVRDASVVGDWLGLSAIEALAAVHVARGDALRAASVIESAHALIPIESTRARLLALASQVQAGAVIWIVGADRGLAIHVSRTGVAQAHTISVGRRDLARASGRIRTATLACREDPLARRRAHDLIAEVAIEILPDSVWESLGAATPGEPAGSIALLPHGIVESLPLELFPVGAGGAPLGQVTAVHVLDRLRGEDERAPMVRGESTAWWAMGAAESTGFAPLPGALKELRSLAALHPRADVVTGRAFDRGALEIALKGDQPLHVATHVVRIDDGDSVAPLGLVVSGGAPLSASEVAALEPRLPLLVLAACGSGDGRNLDGLGLRGIAQVALDAGTRQALVTLWPIEDRAARALSVAFHGALLAGETPGEALRRARVVLARMGAPLADLAAYRLLGAP